jgi:hypothetical protein
MPIDPYIVPCFKTRRDLQGTVVDLAWSYNVEDMVKRRTLEGFRRAGDIGWYCKLVHRGESK